jgi:cell wall-associated NlpC family hydrolase
VLKGKGLHALWVAATTLAVVSIAGTAVADTNYTVRKGDTVYSIAKHHNISVKEVQNANQLTDKSILSIGRTLTIPGAESACTEPSPTTSEPVKTAQADTQREEKRVEDEKTEQKQEVESEDPGSKNIVRTAFDYRGSRYRYGGTSRGGFDCSGFTRYVYAKYGIVLPHSSRSQFSMGKAVEKQDLQAGDLVFFSTRTRGISHVGIYIGDNKFIHASNVRRGVTVDSLSSSYYSPRYRGARRVK